jgi:hypothetical protein
MHYPMGGKDERVCPEQQQQKRTDKLVSLAFGHQELLKPALLRLLDLD